MDGMNNYENYNVVNNSSQDTPKKTNGFAIAGMILGIVSIPASCCFAWVGILVAVLGLIFSIIGQSKGKSGMAIAGIICSVIGILLGITNSVLGAVMASSGAYDELYRQLGIY